MEKPLIQTTPTMAELKEKNITLRTVHYSLTNSQELAGFIFDLEKVANNPLKYSIITFIPQNEVDGSPYVVVRYREDEKVDNIEKNKYSIFGRIYTKFDLDEMDKILNKHDLTNTFLLAEKHFVIRGMTSDFYAMLIWAEIEKPQRQMEGLHALRSIFSRNFC